MTRIPWAVLAVVMGVVGIAASRQPVVAMHSEVNARSEIYALPDPEHLKVFSLGYRSAMADLLFGQTMVAAGIHFVEKRVFENLDAYLHAIVALEPRYRDVYYYADSLLTLSTVVMPKRNYRIARDLQEQGVALFPGDADLWMTSGQFAAYLAVPHLPESEDPAEWKKHGAQLMMRACEVWPEERQVPPSCFSGSGLLGKLGATEAAIRSLERIMVIAKDPKVRADAARRIEYLQRQHSELRTSQARRRQWERRGELERLRRQDLPLASPALYRLTVPPFQPEQCSGNRHLDAGSACRSSFGR